MAASRTTAAKRTITSGTRSAQPRSRKAKPESQLGAKLARHVVAVARGRVAALALEIEPISLDPEPAPVARRLPHGTVRETWTRRWRSERPYQGMSTAVIVRKLKAGALTSRANDHAMRELARRGHRLNAF